jgi:hypothetical protein
MPAVCVSILFQTDADLNFSRRCGTMEIGWPCDGFVFRRPRAPPNRPRNV